MTVLLGTLISGTAVLLDLLIKEAIQLHLISGLIFATVPLAAALTVGAMLVALLWLLGAAYDALRLFVLPGFLWCFCSGAPLLVHTACRLSEYFDATFGRTAGGLKEFAGGIAIDTRQTLRGVGTRARSALEGMSRDIALEALWIKQGVRSVLGATAWIACWPIRTSALLLLRLID
jgi:hypothetical protein